ncbi:hypothetical protein HOY80DRAFT_1056031 [Tuber brumale]|nr:hypothetical protein HOY80DRAFT_1056031 [Tuber brumale]
MSFPPSPLLNLAGIDSPTGSTYQDQPQGQQYWSRQEIRLSKLNTKEELFRYLDFAEGGTNYALNKWGRFLQLVG